MTSKTFVERLTLFLAAAALIAIFRYLGGFHLGEAVLLGAAFAVVAMYIYFLATAVDFKPYQLTIGINYETLWEDFKLSRPAGETFQNFTFTALSAVVFARSDSRGYSAKMDIYQPIPCAVPAWKHDFGGTSDTPTFFFRPVRDGYEFGVHVQQQWWSEQARRFPAELATKIPRHDNAVIVGRLPSGYVPEHVRRWNQPVSLMYPFERKHRKWEAKLHKDGWMIDKNCLERIEHRYLVLWFHEI